MEQGEDDFYIPFEGRLRGGGTRVLTGEEAARHIAHVRKSLAALRKRNDDRTAAAHNGGLSVKQVRQPTTRRTDGHGPVGETG
jgi:hypothetical protein